MDLPWCSSDLLVKILEADGFRAARETSPNAARKKGSHRTYVKVFPDGSKAITYVVLGKKQLPQSSVKTTLRHARMSAETFLRLHSICK